MSGVRGRTPVPHTDVSRHTGQVTVSVGCGQRGYQNSYIPGLFLLPIGGRNETKKPCFAQFRIILKLVTSDKSIREWVSGIVGNQQFRPLRGEIEGIEIENRARQESEAAKPREAREPQAILGKH